MLATNLIPKPITKGNVPPLAARDPGGPPWEQHMTPQPKFWQEHEGIRAPHARSGQSESADGHVSTGK